jgi:hypothetical protein
MRAELGWQSGAKLMARLVDGTIILEPIDVAIHRAQAMVSQYVPQGSGLVEELITERHEAAERD